MKTTIQIVSLLLSLFLIGCTNGINKTTDSKDYDKYLKVNKNERLQLLQLDINFWQSKIDKTPDQFPYYAKIASSLSSLFQQTGIIDHLVAAESNLLIANEKTNFSKASYLRGLARNYISQHKFQEALKILLKAERLGEQLSSTQKMLIDVYLELGNKDRVEEYLTKIKNFNDFDYLIRASKYNDHLGNLDVAIQYLEKSLEIAKTSKNVALLEWNYTNLADYYGHAGKIKASYQAYLKTLELNPNNAYAKKGIAWITYSYERNPEEAMRILTTIIQENSSPDYYLLKSEIADFMQNEEEKNSNLQKYLSLINNEACGAMYNGYKAIIYAEYKTTIEEAIKIAKEEVKERPTPQSYDLLAWAYYKNGNHKEALKIARQHVVGKTFEPTALFHTAHIMKANNLQEEALIFKKDLIGSAFELGPIESEKVNLL
ncbi:MAG: cell surface protein [Flavobacteriaceae bacterium]|nr:cell surface protein [Flavobacteriaceae bacterium]